MKLLEAQPEIAPGAPPEPPVERPPDEPAVDPAARACKSCGATLEPGQDWCLACGTAAGRIASRPGARSTMTVLGLTALLVAGAVGASYAALSEDQTVPPKQSAAAAQVAQAPPATTAPPAATTPPASTTTTPAPGSTSTGKSTIPKVKVPSNTSPAPAPAPATPVPATPRTSPPSTSTPTPSQSSGSSPSSGSSNSGSSGSQTSTGSTTTPKPAAPVAIDLGASAGSIYDPYRRATTVGVPAKALDGDGGTSWFVDTAAGQPTVGVGFVVNVGSPRGIKAVDITTPTPGFKVEIYASDQATPPPAITDTRWAHITDRDDVGADGKTHIVLGGGSSKYQTLLLWITKPPSDGARVRISELRVLG